MRQRKTPERFLFPAIVKPLYSKSACGRKTVSGYAERAGEKNCAPIPYDAFGFFPVPLQGTQTFRCPRALIVPTPRQWGHASRSA
jgi:hypothetical protein